MQAMLTLVSSSTGQLGGHEGCRNLLPKSQPLLPSIFPQINLNFPPAAPHSSCPPPAIGPFGSFSLLRGQRLNRPNDPEPRAAGTAQNTQGRAGRRAPSTRGAQPQKQHLPSRQVTWHQPCCLQAEVPAPTRPCAGAERCGAGTRLKGPREMLRTQRTAELRGEGSAPSGSAFRLSAAICSLCQSPAGPIAFG